MRIHYLQNCLRLVLDNRIEFDRLTEGSRRIWRSRITSVAMWSNAVASHDTWAWSDIAICEQQPLKVCGTQSFLSYFDGDTTLDRWSVAQIAPAMLIEIETEFDLLLSSSAHQHHTAIAKRKKKQHIRCEFGHFEKMCSVARFVKILNQISLH